jgi:hypothetical protein
MIPLTFCLSLAATSFLDPTSAARFWWGDWNNDGLLDAVVQAPGCAPKLLQNGGEGSFTDVSASAGWPILAKLEHVAFADFDGDEQAELALVSGGRLRLFGQDDGVLFERTEMAGLASLSDVRNLRTLDVDGDGQSELWLSWPEGERVLRQAAGGAFEELDLGLLFMPAPEGGSAPAERPVTEGSSEPSDPDEPTRGTGRPGGVGITEVGRTERRFDAELLDRFSRPPEENDGGGVIAAAACGPDKILNVATGLCVQVSSVPILNNLSPEREGCGQRGDRHDDSRGQARGGRHGADHEHADTRWRRQGARPLGEPLQGG